MGTHTTERSSTNRHTHTHMHRIHPKIHFVKVVQILPWRAHWLILCRFFEFGIGFGICLPSSFIFWNGILAKRSKMKWYCNVPYSTPLHSIPISFNNEAFLLYASRIKCMSREKFIQLNIHFSFYLSLPFTHSFFGLKMILYYCSCFLVTFSSSYGPTTTATALPIRHTSRMVGIKH